MITTGFGVGVKHKVKELTNAELLALPTTGIDVVPAPGVNRLILPVTFALVSLSSAGYTNINANAELSIKYANEGSPVAPVIVGGRLSELIGSGAGNTSAILGAGYKDVLAAPGDLRPQVMSLAFGAVNDALRLKINNLGSGNLTGGNVANRFIVVSLYAVIRV